MRGQEVILLNFPISHFLKSLAHSALWQKKLLSESADKVQTMAAQMREDKVKQLFFADCAVYKLCALCM